METGYAPRAVTGQLAGDLLCAWDASFTGLHTLVPDACVELMWLEGRGVVVCGPETSAWTFSYPEPRAAAGVRFRPGAALGILGEPLHHLRDQVVDYAAIVGSRRARLLTDQLQDVPPGTRSSVLESEVAAIGRPQVVPDPASMEQARVFANRSVTVKQLAAELGLSSRQLHRNSLESFGYGPSVLRSILRLQRFMQLARSGPASSLAALAPHAGYTDQAHLARDARRIAGMTPSELMRSEAPCWHGGASLIELAPRERAC